MVITSAIMCKYEHTRTHTYAYLTTTKLDYGLFHCLLMKVAFLLHLQSSSHDNTRGCVSLGNNYTYNLPVGVGGGWGVHFHPWGYSIDGSEWAGKHMMSKLVLFPGVTDGSTHLLPFYRICIIVSCSCFVPVTVSDSVSSEYHLPDVW